MIPTNVPKPIELSADEQEFLKRLRASPSLTPLKLLMRMQCVKSSMVFQVIVNDGEIISWTVMPGTLEYTKPRP